MDTISRLINVLFFILTFFFSLVLTKIIFITICLLNNAIVKSIVKASTYKKNIIADVQS